MSGATLRHRLSLGSAAGVRPCLPLTPSICRKMLSACSGSGAQQGNRLHVCSHWPLLDHVPAGFSLTVGWSMHLQALRLCRVHVSCMLRCWRDACGKLAGIWAAPDPGVVPVRPAQLLAWGVAAPRHVCKQEADDLTGLSRCGQALSQTHPRWSLWGWLGAGAARS